MRQKSGPEKQPAEDAIRDIRRATRRYFSAEEKIRIVLEGLRGEESIAAEKNELRHALRIRVRKTRSLESPRKIRSRQQGMSRTIARADPPPKGPVPRII